MALGVGYEWLRVIQRGIDIKIARSLRSSGNGGTAVSASSDSGRLNEEVSLLTDSAKSRKMYVIRRMVLTGC